MNIFGIKSGDEFEEKVSEIQAKLGLKQDSIIGEETLEFIYKNYYLKMNNLPESVKDRQEVYDYLNNYPGKNKKTTGLFNVITDTNYYYGQNAGFNIPGTYLNERLYRNINKLNLDPNFNNGNSIQIGKTFDQEHFIAMFVNGELKVLSYATVGKKGKESPENKIYTIEFLKKNYISGSYPKRADSDVGDDGEPLGDGGAVMPYAIEVEQEGGYYIHMRKFGNAGSWGTSGCYGIPPKYQKIIYEFIDKKGTGKFKVKIGELYGKNFKSG